jgi:hypothetical protein
LQHQIRKAARLKIPFLSEAAERSPSAIIGRRTTGALLIADIVRTADEYRLSDSGHYAAIGELSRILSEKSGLPADEILEFILWPVQARRAALWPLLDRGSKGITVRPGPYETRFRFRRNRPETRLSHIFSVAEGCVENLSRNWRVSCLASN